MTSETETGTVDPLEAALALPPSLSPLDRKILEQFPGLVENRDRFIFYQ